VVRLEGRRKKSGTEEKEGQRFGASRFMEREKKGEKERMP